MIHLMVSIIDMLIVNGVIIGMDLGFVISMGVIIVIDKDYIADFGMIELVVENMHFINKIGADFNSNENFIGDGLVV